MIRMRRFLLFFLLITLSFTAYGQSGGIFIEGNAASAQHLSFFMENFRTEGSAAGYNITGNRQDAAYIFRFDVSRNMITYEDGSVEAPPADEDQFLIRIILVDNSDGEEVVSFGFTFSELDAMYEYTQFLFLRAAVNIPNGVGAGDPSDQWRNKWLYVRVSADYPIAFYRLLPRGLYEGSAVFRGDDTNNLRPGDWAPIDNRTTALPAASLGVEAHVLDWLSIEPFIQVIFFDDPTLITAAAGGKLMFPIKPLRNLVISPYGAASFSLRSSRAFSSFPFITPGIGTQLSMRAGENGAFFVDLSYWYSYNDARLVNPYGDFYPNPPEIHFRRTSIGLSAGYKMGFFNRN
ncbi:MAG: hypothetical protein FWG77_09250 [Treponema sp.]|nr:hypothetical protein [Treponema sp.]